MKRVYANNIIEYLNKMSEINNNFKPHDLEEIPEFRFQTIDEAEDYYMEHLARHNEDEDGRDRWVEEIADQIAECKED